MQTKSPLIERPLVQNGSTMGQIRIDTQKISGRKASSSKSFSSAIACLDNSSYGPIIFRHTKAVANALNIPLKIIHVLRGANPDLGPSDPIEWQIKCREAQDYLRNILQAEHETIDDKDQVLLTGIAGDELSRWASDHDASLMAVTSRCEMANQRTHAGQHDQSLGAAAQQLLEGSGASLLLIPPGIPDTGVVHYRRLLVPLDGSCRAESVLPFAMRIARAHQAELVLAHVVPRPEVVETGPHDQGVGDLMAPLLKYNEQNARAYLDRLQARLHSDTVVIKSVVESVGDPRDRLLNIGANQDTDLIVISGRGRGGVNNLSCGNIARYLAMHATVPLLMVRQKTNSRVERTRLPEQHRGPLLFRESAH